MLNATKNHAVFLNFVVTKNFGLLVNELATFWLFEVKIIWQLCTHGLLNCRIWTGNAGKNATAAVQVEA